MCKVITGDVWTLTISPTFEGFYFATARVYSEQRRTHDAYKTDGKAFEAGLEVLIDLASEYGIVVEIQRASCG